MDPADLSLLARKLAQWCAGGDSRTEGDFAALIETSASNLSRIKRGLSRADTTLLARISDALALTQEEAVALYRESGHALPGVLAGESAGHAPALSSAGTAGHSFTHSA